MTKRRFGINVVDVPLLALVRAHDSLVILRLPACGFVLVLVFVHGPIAGLILRLAFVGSRNLRFGCLSSVTSSTNVAETFFHILLVFVRLLVALAAAVRYPTRV